MCDHVLPCVTMASSMNVSTVYNYFLFQAKETKAQRKYMKLGKMTHPFSANIREAEAS